MSKLIFYPLPKPRESVISLLFRCGTGNGFQTLRIFSAWTHLNLRNFINPQRKDSSVCNLLSSHSLLEPDERAALLNSFHQPVLYGMSTHVEIAGVAFPQAVLRDRLALCPGCVRDGFLDRLHVFRFSDTCPVHGERYLEHCPQCREPIDWLRLHDYHCPCTFDLRQAPLNLSNKRTSELLSRALDERNQGFFQLLLASIQAVRFGRAPESCSQLIASCVNIATGNKPTFFLEMEKLQGQLPSLHRRALLAPFLLSPDPTLSRFAQEYFYNACQSKPYSHAADCRCGELRFSARELNFIFTSQERAALMRSDHHCIRSPHQDPTVRQRAYQCPDLCRSLYTFPHIQWESMDEPPVPQLEFELMSHQNAAEILQTTPQTIRRLISTGLLKGFKFNTPIGLATSLESIKAFNDKYVLREEIARRSGLTNNKLRKLLYGLVPIVVRTTLYAHGLLVYQRKHLSEELRSLLDRQAASIIKATGDFGDHVTFGEAARQLNVDIKDVKALRNLGILKVVFVAPKQIRHSTGRPYCTTKSLREAIAWRTGYVSVQEVKAATGCDTHLIHTQFLKTGFVPSVPLHNTYITVDGAKIIDRHFKKYTTLTQLSSTKHISTTVISELLELGKLQPLAADHPDNISGVAVFERQEADDAIANYIRERPVRLYRSYNSGIR